MGNLQALRLRSTTARLKLKEIDGGLYKWWSMWFNAIIRVQPYQFLTYKIKQGLSLTDALVLGGKFLYRCCMAVVSSCREMFG
jgi:hypothetical protein